MRVSSLNIYWELYPWKEMSIACEEWNTSFYTEAKNTNLRTMKRLPENPYFLFRLKILIWPDSLYCEDFERIHPRKLKNMTIKATQTVTNSFVWASVFKTIKAISLTGLIIKEYFVFPCYNLVWLLQPRPS